jgi:hypothetical protein
MNDLIFMSGFPYLLIFRLANHAFATAHARTATTLAFHHPGTAAAIFIGHAAFHFGAARTVHTVFGHGRLGHGGGTCR